MLCSPLSTQGAQDTFVNRMKGAIKGHWLGNLPPRASFPQEPSGPGAGGETETPPHVRCAVILAAAFGARPSLACVSVLHSLPEPVCVFYPAYLLGPAESPIRSPSGDLGSTTRVQASQSRVGSVALPCSRTPSPQSFRNDLAI